METLADVGNISAERDVLAKEVQEHPSRLVVAVNEAQSQGLPPAPVLP